MGGNVVLKLYEILPPGQNSNKFTDNLFSVQHWCMSFYSGRSSTQVRDENTHTHTNTHAHWHSLTHTQAVTTKTFHTLHNILHYPLLFLFLVLSLMSSYCLCLTGTIHSSCLCGCLLEDDKSFAKRGRGSFDARVEKWESMAIVKWHDNRSVTLISSHAAMEPQGKAFR